MYVSGDDMRKLNNNGWGFVMFLFFLGVLGVALFMVVYMVNEFESGFSSNERQNVTYSQYQRYVRYEREVANAAANYAKVSDISSNYINISELEIDNDIRSECVGYVFFDEKTMTYIPYLKCGNYQTEGYAQ